MPEQEFPRLLFIGAGNISKSIIKGLIKAQPDAAALITVTAPTRKNLDLLEALGCQTCLLTNVTKELTRLNPKFVFLCVKPQVLIESVSKCDPLANLLRSIPHRCITLSLLAGIKCDLIASAFNLPERNVIRVMLNTAAEINCTSTFYYCHSQVQIDLLTEIVLLFNLIGQPVMNLKDENLMDVATGVCGSGIALFFEAIQAFSDIATKNGLNRAEATQIAAQLSKSAGQMVLSRNAHPYQLRDEVSSPAGTTIFGLHQWHESSTNQKIGSSIQAAIDRSRHLSKASEEKLYRVLSD